jgi:hypothetical protein
MSPKLHWLVTKPLALSINLILAGLDYCVLLMGVPAMVSAIDEAKMLSHNITLYFGSTWMFVEIFRFVFWFSIFAQHFSKHQ